MGYDFDGRPGEYHYSQSEHGKTASGVVAVGAQSKRDLALQRTIGGEEREPSDHGGHLIAHSLGGRNDASNLDPQSANVNQINQRAVEREVARVAQEPGKTVYVEVSNYTGTGSQRPDATMITVAVRDDMTGLLDVEYYSFQNATGEEQAQWAQMADEVAALDPHQDEGLTPEQRVLANELSDAEVYDRAPLGAGHTVVYDGGDLTQECEAIGQGYDGGSLESQSSAEQSGGQEIGMDDGMTM